MTNRPYAQQFRIVEEGWNVIVALAASNQLLGRFLILKSLLPYSIMAGKPTQFDVSSKSLMKERLYVTIGKTGTGKATKTQTRIHRDTKGPGSGLRESSFH
jgi:hypothetical protein